MTARLYVKALGTAGERRDASHWNGPPSPRLRRVRRSFRGGGSERVRERVTQVTRAKSLDQFGCGGVQPAVLAAVEYCVLTMLRAFVEPHDRSQSSSNLDSLKEVVQIGVCQIPDRHCFRDPRVVVFG